MHLLLLSELISALRANDSDTFKRWLSGGIQDLGQTAVEELMLGRGDGQAGGLASRGQSLVLWGI